MLKARSSSETEAATEAYVRSAHQALPVHDAEDSLDQREARRITTIVTHLLITTLFVLSVSVVLVLSLSLSNSWGRYEPHELQYSVVGIAILVCLFGLHLARKGRPQQAALTMICVASLAALSSLFLDATGSIYPLLFTLVVVLSGLSISPRAAWFTGIGSATIILVAGAGQSMALWTFRREPEAFGVVIFEGLLVIVVAALISAARRGFDEAVRAFRNHQGRYATLFAQSPAGILTIDATRRLEGWNARAEALMRGHLVLKAGISVEALHITGLDEALSTAQARGEAQTRRSYVLPGQEHARRIELGAVWLQLPTWEGWQVLLHDLSKVAKAEAEVRDLQAQLQQVQKMESVGRLAGGIAHDFNNLLTVILNNAIMLTQVETLDPEDRELAEEIHGAGTRGSELARQLMALGRRDLAAPEQVDLRGLIEGFEAMLRRMVGPDIIIEVTGSDEPAMVLIDPGQFEQVIANLAINGAHAMPKGGRLLIRTHHDDDGQVCVQVSDTGVGMSAATQARVFEPFFTTRNPDEGNGLGMAVVHGIITRAGGRIDLESELGRGTCVTITLPQMGGEPTWRQETGESEPLEQWSLAELNILVVDDDASALASTRRVLEAADAKVSQATSASEALSMPDEELAIFDLIVTDMMMPGVSGEGLIRALRKRALHVPIVVYSGYSGTFDVQAFAEGGVALLKKPVATGVLVQALAKLHQSHGLSQHDSSPSPKPILLES